MLTYSSHIYTDISQQQQKQSLKITPASLFIFQLTKNSIALSLLLFILMNIFNICFAFVNRANRHQHCPSVKSKINVIIHISLEKYANIGCKHIIV